MGLGWLMLRAASDVSDAVVGLTLAVAMVLSRPTIRRAGAAVRRRHASLLAAVRRPDASRLVPALTLLRPGRSCPGTRPSWACAARAANCRSLGNALFAVVDENNGARPADARANRRVVHRPDELLRARWAASPVPRHRRDGGAGARSGRAPLIFGATMLAIGLFFADAGSLLFARGAGGGAGQHPVLASCSSRWAAAPGVARRPSVRHCWRPPASPSGTRGSRCCSACSRTTRRNGVGSGCRLAARLPQYHAGRPARVTKPVDVADLKSAAARRAGSSPAPRTRHPPTQNSTANSVAWKIARFASSSTATSAPPTNV